MYVRTRSSTYLALKEEGAAFRARLSMRGKASKQAASEVVVILSQILDRIVRV